MPQIGVTLVKATLDSVDSNSSKSLGVGSGPLGGFNFKEKSVVNFVFSTTLLIQNLHYDTTM